MKVDVLREALAARPGQPVPFDELIAAVWGAEPPANPKAALRNLVQRLRASDQVMTEPSGYRLVPRKAGPRHLPADLPDFVGRSEEVATALESTAPVLAITGPPGVGKTSLAVHIGHRLSERFPDGQLYLNLRAFSENAVLTPHQALSRFLRALGAEQVPTGLDEQIALYRKMTADRALLVVIDNATRELLGPLLPGGRCRVLVTSRTDLPEHEQLKLGVFADDEARELLARMRVDGAEAERDELIRWCARLPLALRIAAAHLTDRHLPDYLADLRGDRLDALEIEGDAAVRTTFELSYRAQPEVAQRLFRLLGQVPGPDFGVEAATALLGADAAAPLRLLAEANLVQHHGNRYSLHDLLRAYARQLDAPDSSRLYDYYLVNAHAAGRTLNPEQRRLPLPDTEPVPLHDVSDKALALAWLDEERANVVAAVQAAEDRPIAWQLTDAMRAYFLYHADLVDWIAAAESGLRAALALHDDRAEATMRGSLGLALWRGGRSVEALPEFDRALPLARRLDDLQLLYHLLVNNGIVHWELSNLAEAAELLREAVRLDPQPTALFNLSSVLADVGPLDVAVAYTEQALRVARERDMSTGIAFCLGQLALHHIYLGDFAAAESCLDELEPLIGPDLGPVFLSRHLENRAFLLMETGRLAEAENLARRALDIAVECENDNAEADARATFGAVRGRLGFWHEAVEQHSRALEIAQKIGAVRPEVHLLTNLAADHRVLGELDEALRYATAAVDRAERGQQRVRGVAALAELAEVYRARALELARETGLTGFAQPPANGGSTSS